MPRALVTGAAGFIGSQLTERLLIDGYEVVGVDCMSDYYSPSAKKENIAGLTSHPGFRFIESDLNDMDIAGTVANIDVIFHLAGQPGVRGSWANGFGRYVADNVSATQRLLEAASHREVRRFIYSSSSSVYGDSSARPTDEESLPRPVSPYGVTKLAAEHLVHAYGQDSDLETISLRYFTVYGPRQRPDMAAHRLIESCLVGREFQLYGDGTQRRDFTFVSDVVDANIRAAQVSGPEDAVINISGGSSVSVNDLIASIERIVGASANVVRMPTHAGDVRDTCADRSRSEAVLDWVPRTTLDDGLQRQVDWHLGHHGHDVTVGQRRHSDRPRPSQAGSGRP